MHTDKKIITYPQLQTIAHHLHHQGKRIVLTTGCYELLHLGHITHLHYCKSQGDVLVVSVGNDKTVRHLKGQNRPLHNERVRARMLASLAATDYVVISEEFGKMDHTKLVNILRPDIYVVPGTDSALTKKRAMIERVGGKLLTCRRTPPATLRGISTTKILKTLETL